VYGELIYNTGVTTGNQEISIRGRWST